MCFLDKEDWSHVRLIIWRARLLFVRNKKAALYVFGNCLGILLVALVARAFQPIRQIAESANFDRLMTYTSNSYYP